MKGSKTSVAIVRKQRLLSIQLMIGGIFVFGFTYLVSYLSTKIDITSNTIRASNPNDDSNTHHVALNFLPHYTIYEEIIRNGGQGYTPTRHLTWLPEVQGSYWWLNESVPESFSFPILDQTYDAKYFKQGGHPIFIAELYVDYVLEYTRLFLPQQKVQTLVEFGNGGGYFSKRFSDILGPSNYITVEGTGEGIAETLGKWLLPPEQVVQHDLRLPLFLGKRFDVAVCTEVVEHVEPPFASQIILTLISHADVIWFSFKPLGLTNRAWINHPNERPIKMWKNLFNFYGYDIVMLPNQVTVAVQWRGNFIAYRRANKDLLKVTEQDFIDRIIKTNN